MSLWFKNEQQLLLHVTTKLYPPFWLLYPLLTNPNWPIWLCLSSLRGLWLRQADARSLFLMFNSFQKPCLYDIPHTGNGLLKSNSLFPLPQVIQIIFALISLSFSSHWPFRLSPQRLSHPCAALRCPRATHASTAFISTDYDHFKGNSQFVHILVALKPLNYRGITLHPQSFAQ